MMTTPTALSSALHRIRTWGEKFNATEYYWLTRPFLVFLVTRFIVFLGAYLAEIILPSMVGDGYYHANPNNIILDVWARWDSAFYLSIVDKGYFFALGQQSSVAFFPLYPLLTSFLAPVAGSTLAAGVLVSNTMLLGALIFLYRLAELEFGDSSTATRTIMYIALFPTSFFFSAVYTESTFLFFAIATMYFARKKLWVWAGLFGLLCSSSRIVGVMMFGVVGLEWLRAQGWTLFTIHKKEAWLNMLKGIRHDWLNLLSIGLIPLGLASYMLFLKNQFNDPVAFSTTQSAWGREMLGPIAIVIRDLGALFSGNFLTGQIWYHVLLDVTALFAVLFISIAIWRRLGASYALYGMISILIPASSGTGSISRYALVIFPMFMILGYWGKNQLLDRAIMIVFSVLLGILTAGFVNWVFIA